MIDAVMVTSSACCCHPPPATAYKHEGGFPQATNSDKIIVKMASLRGGLEQRCDLTGLPLTCCSDEALEWYNKALVAHVSYRENPVPFVTRALELDESLLLGHCLLVSSAAAGNTSS